MLKPIAQRQIKATQVFDLEDAFARERRIHGRHPRPFGWLTFYVVAQLSDTDSRQDFAQPLKLITVPNLSGYHLFFGQYALDDKTKRQNLLADGRYFIRVEGQYYQPIEEVVTLPMPDPEQPVFFDLLPGYAYPWLQHYGRHFTLLYGKVQDGNEDGIANVTITVEAQSIQYQTDQTGRWGLRFPDTWQTSTVTLHFTKRNGSSQSVANVLVIQNQTNSIPPVTLSG